MHLFAPDELGFDGKLLESVFPVGIQPVRNVVHGPARCASKRFDVEAILVDALQYERGDVFPVEQVFQRIDYRGRRTVEVCRLLSECCFHMLLQG